MFKRRSSASQQNIPQDRSRNGPRMPTTGTAGVSQRAMGLPGFFKPEDEAGHFTSMSQIEPQSRSSFGTRLPALSGPTTMPASTAMSVPVAMPGQNIMSATNSMVTPMSEPLGIPDSMDAVNVGLSRPQSARMGHYPFQERVSSSDETLVRYVIPFCGSEVAKTHQMALEKAVRASRSNGRAYSASGRSH